MVERRPRTSFACVLTSLEDVALRTGQRPRSGDRSEVLRAKSLPLRMQGQEGLVAWDIASDWTRDLAEGTALEERPTHRCDPALIARELALGPEIGVEELKARRRAFMWQNHPDRGNLVEMDVATERVAVANMLIDAAIARVRARDSG